MMTYMPTIVCLIAANVVYAIMTGQSFNVPVDRIYFQSVGLLAHYVINR